jgi:hypothetical protein
MMTAAMARSRRARMRVRCHHDYDYRCANAHLWADALLEADHNVEHIRGAGSLVSHANIKPGRSIFP